MPSCASVILASRNEGAMLRRTLESIQRADCQIPYEVILVDDGSTDGSVPREPFDHQVPLRVIRTAGLGVAPARNAGARLAQGEMLVFCDAHISVPAGWLDALARTLEEEGCDAITPGIAPLEPKAYLPLHKIAASAPLHSVGCGRVFDTLVHNAWLPKHDHPVECPILSGGCFAVRREVWERVGGYEDAFRGYGYDEEEISLKLWLFGYRLMTVPEVVILHQFRPAAPYPIVGGDMIHNRVYTGLCHLGEARMQRLWNHMRAHPDFEASLREAFTPENLRTKREAYRAARVYDDDWYFHRFAPAL